MALKRRYKEYYNEDWETVKRYRVTSSNPTPVLFSTHNVLTNIDNWNMAGYDIPNYHKRKARGELLEHTPYRRYRVYGHSTAGYDMTYYNTACTTWTHYYLSGGSSNYSLDQRWVISEADISSVDVPDHDRFVTDAAAKIYNHSFDMLTFLAELTDLKRLYVSTADKILNLGKLKQFKGLSFPEIYRLAKKAAKSNWRSVPDQWLEFRYGWRPLINDLKNIAELIQGLHEKRTRHAERVGYQMTHTDFSSEVVNDAPEVRYVTTISNSITVKGRGSVVADIELPDIQFNVFATAWEKLTLSFVFDWFVSIGKQISALSFLHLQTGYVASKGYQVKVIRTLTTTCEMKSCHEGLRYQEAVCTGLIEVRTPCSVPLTPYLSCNLDWKKVVDLTTLLLQRV